VDVLSDLLQRSRARGAAFSRSVLRGQWALEFPVTGTLAVHAIVSGDLWAWGADPAAAQPLAAGDVVILRASPHFLGTSPGRPTIPFHHVLRNGFHPAPGEPADGPAAEFCCGAYLFDGDLSRPLLDALPELVRLRPAAGSALRASVDLLLAEMRASEGLGPVRPGQQALLDRLLDVVLVHGLREWLSRADTAPGWFRACGDPSLDAALSAVHADPARPWTVAELARTAGTSRSAFARQFTDTVGLPPLAYLTRWRIALAKERLRDSRDGLAAIAAAVGYSSEFSFASAFKRQVGLPPGRWRTENAPTELTAPAAVAAGVPGAAP
jgi:AraC-like DNA-binding protein